MNRLLERLVRPAILLASRHTYAGKALASGVIVLAALGAALVLQDHALQTLIAATEREHAGVQQVRARVAFWREVVLGRDQAIRERTAASGPALTPSNALERLRGVYQAAPALAASETPRLAAAAQGLARLDPSATKLHAFAAYTRLSGAALEAMEESGRASGLYGDAELDTAADMLTRHLPALLENVAKQLAVAELRDEDLAAFALGAQLIVVESGRRTRTGLERLAALRAAGGALLERFDAFIVRAREIGEHAGTAPAPQPPPGAREAGGDLLRDGFAVLDAALDAVQAHLARRLERQRDLRLAVSAAVLALALGLMYLWLGGVLSVRRSLEALERGSREVRAGRLEARVEVESRDELGAVAENFNRIAEDLGRILEERRAIGLQAQRELEVKVAERTEALSRANRELAAAMESLRAAQDGLVESGKMAALGGLVAGVAHEVNTPIGLAYTMVTHLEEHLREIARRFAAGELRTMDFERFLAAATPSAEHAAKSLRRAADLVQSFKQVAVDQASEARRAFDLETYLREIAASLGSALRKGGHRVEVRVARAARLDSYPGALSQIVTNVILNAVTHGFEGRTGGLVRIDAESSPEGRCVIRISDDGKGMPPGVAQRVFEPFFTTRRSSGGSGLGLDIGSLLAARRLGGSLRCESVEGEGSAFTLVIPAAAPAGSPGPEASGGRVSEAA